MASLGGPLQPISMHAVVALYSLGILKFRVSKYRHWHPLGASLQPISMHAIVALYSLKSRVSEYHCAYIYTWQYTPPNLTLT